MKTTLYSLLAAAACGMALGQTAYTTPVGYVSMNVTGGGTVAAPSQSFIGPSLANSVIFQGLSLGTGTGSTVNFSGTPFTLAQFGLNSSGEAKFYAEVVTGPNAGLWSDIASNTTSSITCDDAIASVFASQQIVIRQHHTLASLFGTTSATVAFKAAASISSADELSLQNSLTQVPSIFFFSNFDGDEDGFEDGWLTASGNPASDKVISPMDGIKVKRKAAGALAIVQSGNVNLIPVKIPIYQGLNVLPVNRAVGSSLRLSPLTASGASGGRTGSNLLGSGMTGAASLTGADELTVLTNGIPVIYFYTTFDGDEDGFPDGWVKSNGDPAGDLVIPEGSGLRIKRKIAGPFTWTIPNEPIDQSPIIGVSN